MTKRKTYRSSKFAKKKRRKRIIHVIVWVVFLVAIISGLAWWSGHDSLTINQIEISENEFINNTDTQKMVGSIISEHYALIFSKKNFLILPRAEIKKQIKDENLSVSKVELNTEDRNILNIKIIEHKPVAKWCGFDKENLSEDCFLINEKALIFARESKFDQKNIIKFYGIFESEENILGKKYLTENNFQNIIKITSNLSKLKIKATSVDTADQETFAIQTLRGPYILININDDSSKVLNNLKTVIEIEEINDAQFENLEYIDLRFGNKVYYKIK